MQNTTAAQEVFAKQRERAINAAQRLVYGLQALDGDNVDWADVGSLTELTRQLTDAADFFSGWQS